VIEKGGKKGDYTEKETGRNKNDEVRAEEK
jgi:hypothetical protein